MGNTTPTRLSFIQSVRLLALLVFRPNSFIEEENKDNKHRNTLPDDAFKEPRALVLRHALFLSLISVLCSGLLGCFFGLLMVQICPAPPSFITTAMQILGALLLLWATLFVRGWDIQSYGGATFTECANRWIYRLLYCTGTAVLVLSLVWP